MENFQNPGWVGEDQKRSQSVRNKNSWKNIKILNYHKLMESRWMSFNCSQRRKRKLGHQSILSPIIRREMEDNIYQTKLINSKENKVFTQIASLPGIVFLYLGRWQRIVQKEILLGLLQFREIRIYWVFKNLTFQVCWKILWLWGNRWFRS